MDTSKMLTEYEMDRKPHEIFMDDTVGISPKLLNRELMCPICLDILNQTMTTKECLHRFCSGCINKALRSGNKECPTCRKKLSSRRCLRADPNFDQLIKKIYDKESERPPLNSKSSIAPECEVILRSLDGCQTRFLKCPFSTTIDHLTRYISMRPDCTKTINLNTDNKHQLCIVEDSSRGMYKRLEGSDNLEKVMEDFKRDTSKPLEVYFYEQLPKKEEGK